MTQVADGDRRGQDVGWAEALDRVRWLGPGLVMAATAIGASHLVLAPTAGASFGYALLWVVLLSHLFKYPAFEFGPRYAVAADESLLDGYRDVPGPRGWALWVFLAGTVVQGVSVLAGVLGVASAVAAAAVPGLPLWAWSLLLGAACGMLLWSGGFGGLSGLSKWMLAILAAMTAVAFLATPPPASAWARLVVPEVPGGAVLLLAALLGWMPTGIDVSVWHSLWALERRDEWRERAGGSERAASLRVGLTDMRIGYGLSFVLAVMTLTLGAEVLRPTGSVPEGADVALTLARLYTDVLGEWMFPVFLVAAFFGMFSSAYGVLDGFPRAFEATVRRLPLSAGADREGSGPLYWGFLWGTLILAVAETALLPDPVMLVTVAAVASFLLAPVTFGLNYWCVTRLVDDRELRPGRLLRGWAVAGIFFMAAATGLYLWLHVL
ncbi:MAG: divalent metal cation transporter [Candidatus Palauibacterales bacterium]|nr:divalent metal cation transporter [Candidatus Palauibacterales bacterium]